MEMELLNKIMDLAENDDRISSVILTGSRSNPNAIVDEFSDLDIIMGVSDLPSFQTNDDWLSFFGDILILQKPESMLSTRDSNKEFKEMYLMQFRNGSRLDLAVVKETQIKEVLDQELFCQVLLDKTGTINLQEPNENTYISDRLNLTDCVNEFLWLSFYVVKGCQRKQLMYTHNHLNMMREEFLNLIIIQQGGNPGAHHKNTEKYLNAYELNLFKETFNPNVYNAIKILFELFESHLKKENFDLGQFEEIRYRIESELQTCMM